MTEKTFPCQEVGSLAKPGWLVQAPSRGHATEAEIEAAAAWGKRLGVEDHGKLVALLEKGNLKEKKETLRDWASLYALRLFESAGLDLVYDGEQRRVEMYEYPIRRARGFRFLDHVRSFDNKYYRKAAAVDRVRYEEAYHLDELLYAKEKARRPVKVPITGPYTLAEWSFNEYYLGQRKDIRDLKKRSRLAKRDLVLDLAQEVVRPNIRALEAAGADVIQVDEPAATTHPEEVDLFVEGFNEATDTIRTKLACHICYSDYRLLYPHVLEMKRCQQFLWEIANKDARTGEGYAHLNLFKEHDDGREVGIGVVDVHVDEVEGPERVRDRVLQAAEVLDDPERVYVNPDCGLRTRTWEVAYAKLQNMVEGARLAREAWAGA